MIDMLQRQQHIQNDFTDGVYADLIPILCEVERLFLINHRLKKYFTKGKLIIRVTLVKKTVVIQFEEKIVREF